MNFLLGSSNQNNQNEDGFGKTLRNKIVNKL